MMRFTVMLAVAVGLWHCFANATCVRAQSHAYARLEGDQLRLQRVVFRPQQMSAMRTVNRDGQQVTEPYTAVEPRATLIPVNVPLDQATVRTVAGNPVSAADLAAALKKDVPVLIASATDVPDDKALSVFRPEVLLILIKAPVAPAGPPPTGNATGSAPPQNAAPPIAATGPAAPTNAPPATNPPANLPPPNAPPANAPPPNFAPPTPSGPLAPPPNALPQPSVPLPAFMAPQVGSAALREGRVEVKQTSRSTAKLTGLFSADDKSAPTPVPLDGEITTLSVKRIDPQYVRATRGETGLSGDELKAALAQEQAVLLSIDGRPVDKFYLRMVRPEVISLRLPVPPPPPVGPRTPEPPTAAPKSAQPAPR